MIILYALASIITMLLLLIIVGGAIKARRHPERYGPQARLRPRQSRAKGIAMAMLETLPIVRFGDPESAPHEAKSGSSGKDVEMTSVTEQSVPSDQPSNSTRPPPPSHLRSISGDADICEAPAQSDTTDNGPSADTHTQPPERCASTTEVPNNSLTNNEDNSLGCSICAEDFKLGEDLRVLPCKHRFHAPCVDPWLLNVSGTCPLCRIDLRPTLESRSDGQEGTDAFFSPFAMSVLGGTRRPQSTIGSIMRGTRGVDRRSVTAATREERIRMLRRWREERQAGTTTDSATVTDTNPEPSTNVSTLRRSSLRLSRRFRDGFRARSSRNLNQDGNDAVAAAATDERPRTWYAGTQPPTTSGALNPNHNDVDNSNSNNNNNNNNNNNDLHPPSRTTDDDRPTPHS
jgi:hypothetical protein